MARNTLGFLRKLRSKTNSSKI